MNILPQKPFGNTGILVSPICFGSLTIGPVQANFLLEQGAEVLAYAIKRGINFVDTAQLYETYPYIRRAMQITGQWDLVISSKTYAYTAQMAHAAVEQARRELDRDMVDIFMLHEQESIHTLNGHREALEVLFDYQSKGIIRAVGASMHHIAAVYGAIEKGLDVIHPLLNINGLGIVDGSRTEMEEAVHQAHQKGIGVFAMKALGGGNLFHTASECLTYAFGNPHFDSVAIGMQSAEEVDANLEFYYTGAFSQENVEKLVAKQRHLHIDDWCSGCGSCVKRCSQQALSLKEGVAFCDHARCVLCGYCSTVCPMWAIKMI